MAIATLNNIDARRLFLDRHALVEQPSGPASGRSLYDLIHGLGFVQLDSINTLARAHDMILYSRRPTYRPGNLKRLYEKDRAFFEHWTHDAAVIPMAFYQHWRLRFRRDAELLKSRWRNWRREGFERQFEPVLQFVRDHGPVCSSDVGQDEQKSGGGWWDWHPSKTALEYLWRSGVLSVVGRDGFRKKYDLTERVIETGVSSELSAADVGATIDWCCRSALDRLGFATSGEIAAFWATVTPAEARQWCTHRVEAGDLLQIEITCADGAPRRVFARPETTGLAAGIAPPPGRLRVLSPFDPVLRDRARAERLFGFHYRIEVFVPAARRKYGYYVFPLLEGDRLIGRIDMKANRSQDRLEVRAVWPERKVVFSKSRLARLDAELNRVARFSGLKDLSFSPGWMRDPV